MNEFVKQQWAVFCDRLDESAKYLASGDSNLETEYMRQASAFKSSHNPESYNELLSMIDAATNIAVRWKDEANKRKLLDSDSQTSTPTKSAYEKGDNHDPMPMPTETMAEQAEQTRFRK